MELSNYSSFHDAQQVDLDSLNNIRSIFVNVLNDYIARHKMTPLQVAMTLGISVTDADELYHGHINNLSLDNLAGMLGKAGITVGAIETTE